MNDIIKYKNFEEERALYGINNTKIEYCSFMGELDGESPLKECKNIIVEHTTFELRYPLWHDENLLINNVILTPSCRAALWYCNKVKINDSTLHGIKALRECEFVELENLDVISAEFGWFCNNVRINKCTFESEYAFLKSKNLVFENMTFNGKYSFQYVENAVFKNCNFDTKDAFWHGKNIMVMNSVVKGEYLAWYGENIKFINCKIIGTQPLCYCKNLELIDCEMIDCDLAFEKSSVNANILNHMISIKNPLSGTINVLGVDEIIKDDEIYQGEVVIIK